MILTILVMGERQIALARVHFVDPNSQSNRIFDGTEKFPWHNLQAVIDNGQIRSGDQVILMSGMYGKLSIKNKKAKSPISISAAKNQKPQFSSIQIRDSENWRLKNLVVSASFAGTVNGRYMIEIGDGTDRIHIEGFDIFTVSDATKWTAEDWDEKAVSGI
ncbi:MAG: hypothetical protein JKY04_00755, partial [Sneathiella sp.]|nr:hypothetical protein [Sneathiella sp.]